MHVVRAKKRALPVLPEAQAARCGGRTCGGRVVGPDCEKRRAIVMVYNVFTGVTVARCYWQRMPSAVQCTGRENRDVVMVVVVAVVVVVVVMARM